MLKLIRFFVIILNLKQLKTFSAYIFNILVIFARRITKYMYHNTIFYMFHRNMTPFKHNYFKKGLSAVLLDKQISLIKFSNNLNILLLFEYLYNQNT